VTAGRIARSVTATLAVAIALVAGLAAPAQAKTLEEIFNEANQAYFHGDYPAAVRGYEELVIVYGVEDADVTYNLATAYARQRKWGHAIRWYERTLRLEPGDEGAQAALAAARAVVGNRRAQAEGEATIETRPPFGEAVVRPFPANLLAWLLVALDFVFFGVLAALRFASKEAVRLGLGIAAPLLGLALLAVGAGVVVKNGTLERGVPGIVVEDAAQLHEGPNPWSTTRGAAREGESARILETLGGFAHVRLANGREGWLKARDVGAIE